MLSVVLHYGGSNHASYETLTNEQILEGARRNRLIQHCGKSSRPASFDFILYTPSFDAALRLMHAHNHSLGSLVAFRIQGWYSLASCRCVQAPRRFHTHCVRQRVAMIAGMFRPS
jgi:hypothetical protein